ncbi:MAG: efflux RND transporter periplasmic adaptor subunit [Desulfobacterales bacterium]|nr:efflux RND transporter periplasmic adaptor subunit [Desulfobacterales bacterium]
MNKENKNKFPFRTVVVTAVVTVILSFGAMHLMGRRSPNPGTAPPDSGSAAESQGAQLWTCGMHPWIITGESGLCPICNMDLTPKREDKAAASNEGGEREIAYWRAPMNPMEIYDKPGKSKMGMDLVPVHEDEIVGGVEIKIDPVTEQNMGVRIAPVEEGPLVHTIRTYGHITYDETRLSRISPKVDGWIEKLHVDFTGDMVEKGRPLYEIYSPRLLAAQEEFLTAVRGGRLLASARRKLTWFDMADREIDALKAANAVSKTVLIRSPYRGVVTRKNAVEGGFVKAGQTVYAIADLSRVWVEAHIYEYELDRVAVGQEAEMTLPYRPGEIYRGKVAYIDPYLQQKTRDVIIRVEFDNPDLALKPDMYADVRVKTGGSDRGLIIPSEAVIRSGERNVVFVARGGGRFTPRETLLGMSLDGGKVQVLSGLAPGDLVVSSGQFLLDSESKLQEAVQKMMAARSGPIPAKKEKTDDFFEDMETGSDDDFFEDMK